jgi:hypothetical protein
MCKCKMIPVETIPGMEGGGKRWTGIFDTLKELL